MYYELALISVAIAGAYWGLYFVRSDQTRTYGAMQLAAAVMAGLGLLARKTDGPAAMGIVGAIGVGAGTCLLLVGPVVRALARRAAAAERFRLANALLDVAEVLAPGSGINEEKALLGAMREIRDGNIEQTVEALTSAKHTAPPDARLAIDERIAMLYLAAYRWDEAIAHAEANLFGAPPPESASIGHLRRVLGVAPPVWVELLGAYGYKGDLDQAARMLARLEAACAGRDDAAIWVHRGRMIFLALAGRVAAVEQLVEPRRSRHMSRAARTYWMAVAHERKGDGRAAEAAYTKARARSRGRPRVLIDRALERLHDDPKKSPTGDIRQIELGPAAAELVKQVEAAPPPEVALPQRPSPPRATRVLTGGVLAVAIVIAIALGESTDVGVLMRAGALMRGLVDAGEWWRIVSAIFVHFTGLHLLVNVICLWFLGRVCEELYGSARTIALFALAGIAGELASYFASAMLVSAGASGAVLGLLGAVFAELLWQRGRRVPRPRTPLLASLAIVALGQLGIDFVYNGVTDQWAHAGGLAAGFVFGLALSPQARWAGVSKWFARVVAIGFGVVCVFAAVMVARTSLADSLGTPSHALVVPKTGIAMTVPPGWGLDKDGVVQDPDNIVNVQVSVADSDMKPALDAWTRDQQKSAHDLGFDQIDLATEHLVALPPGWEGSELAVSFSSADPITGRQRYRVVVAARPLDGKIVRLGVYIPETLARADGAFFTALVASVASAK